MTKSIGIAVIALASAFGQSSDLAAERLRAHVRFLASDLLEGRGIGQRGGDLATEYIATEFALAGARPAGEGGGWFQAVPLVGVETRAESRLAAGRLAFRWLDDFVGVSHLQVPETRVEADAVFAGYGITAPEFGWDDFKGADVRGKVLVLFTNEPASSDPAFFGGKALTYYGRWTYKFEEALRRGAAGALIVHTPESAGYGWEVVRNSSAREQPFAKLGAGERALALAGWLSGDAGTRLFAAGGYKLEDLLNAAGARSFRPIPLRLKIRGEVHSRVRRLETRNVAALVPGSDPALRSEAVMFTAHWDHLGIGAPVDGDRIYNGAVDNATGCAVLLELARTWAALPQKPRRSALFLAVTAEEGGLRGSQYYVRHPLVSLAKTVLALNFDSISPLGRTRDVVTPGAERTWVWPLVQQAARRFDLLVKPDPRPELGGYFRSDHFPLARAGVPAFSIRSGSDYFVPPAELAALSKNYHQPSDEYRDEWDFSGIEQIARFGMLVAVDAANQDRPGASIQ